MKTRKFTAMLLTLAMAFSLLTVSAGAVMDNDHDRISVDTAGPLSVVWDSETVDSEAYHTGDIVSSEDGYYPSSFYLYVDSAEENGITVTGGTLSAPVEETEGGTKYLVTNNSGGSIVIRLANAAQSNNVYTLTFAAPEGQMAGGPVCPGHDVGQPLYRRQHDGRQHPQGSRRVLFYRRLLGCRRRLRPVCPAGQRREPGLY